MLKFLNKYAYHFIINRLWYCKSKLILSTTPYLYYCVVPWKKVYPSGLVVCFFAGLTLAMILLSDATVNKMTKRSFPMVIKPFTKVWYIWVISFLLQLLLIFIMPKPWWGVRSWLSFILFISTLIYDSYYIWKYMKKSRWYGKYTRL